MKKNIMMVVLVSGLVMGGQSAHASQPVTPSMLQTLLQVLPAVFAAKPGVGDVIGGVNTLLPKIQADLALASSPNAQFGTKVVAYAKVAGDVAMFFDGLLAFLLSLNDEMQKNQVVDVVTHDQRKALLAQVQGLIKVAEGFVASMAQSMGQR
ncbi:MAG: hypothetical protein NTX86_04945 [Candidatus Dependentiae bacterium]|nr:hypothetical protein [Candidatus Dependentiae bacterium]